MKHVEVNKREELQEKYKNEWLSSSRRAVLLLAPRIGKTKIAINIIEEAGYKKILVAFPRNDIKSSWDNELDKLGVLLPGLVYTTFVSLHKHLEEQWDLIIIDEIQEASDNVLDRVPKEGDILCLTGTMTKTTENNILERTGIYVCSEYTIKEAVEDGVICDYEINVHRIELEGIEAHKFNILNRRHMKAEGSYKNMLKLQMIGLLQKSEVKVEYTKALIKKYEEERLLIFCGQTEIADKLGIPVYHSKKKEKQIFDDFCKGNGQHLACVKLIQAGITILPINRGIINYTSGASEDCAQKICRFLGKELYAPGKKAIIEFLSINEPFDQQRVKTALNMFDNSKINYI